MQKQKLLQFLMGLKEEGLPQQASKLNLVIPYVEVDISPDFDTIIKNVLSGVFAFCRKDGIMGEIRR